MNLASLQRGAEQLRTLPLDGQRGYAGQILNLMMANNITQRRHPPQYYHQESPTGPCATGEQLCYANGSPVAVRGELTIGTANGKEIKVPVWTEAHQSGVSCADMKAEPET
jgi:hypothetical protein